MPAETILCRRATKKPGLSRPGFFVYLHDIRYTHNSVDIFCAVVTKSLSCSHCRADKTHLDELNTFDLSQTIEYFVHVHAYALFLFDSIRHQISQKVKFFFKKKKKPRILPGHISFELEQYSIVQYKRPGNDVIL